MNFLPHAINPSMGLGLGIHAEDGRKKFITPLAYIEKPADKLTLANISAKS